MKLNNVDILLKNKITNFIELKNIFDEIINKRDLDVFIKISEHYREKPWNSNDLYNVFNILHSQSQHINNSENTVSITATGGEKKIRTLYVSFISSIIVSLFKPVFMQGNRAVTGCNCGSFAEADIVELFGYNQNINTQEMNKLKNHDNFLFLYALKYHPLLEKYHRIRGVLGFRDIFKVASTLANPTDSDYLFLCIYSREQLYQCKEILLKRQIKHGVIVNGSDGIDEASISGKTIMADIKRNSYDLLEFEPKEFGLTKYNIEEVSSCENIEDELIVIKEILSGVGNKAKIDLCILNAGLALYASDVVDDIKSGIQLAKESIYNGNAFNTFNEIFNLTS